MNKLLKLIEVIGVEVEERFSPEASYYDPETNTIYMSLITSHPVFKLVTGRPIQNDWSLSHEVGHALVEFLALGKSKDCRKLFGNFALEYPDDGLMFSPLLEEDKDYITKYAQTHPEEDFADTFAFCLCGENEQLRGKSERVKNKVKFVKSLIQETLKKRG